MINFKQFVEERQHICNEGKFQHLAGTALIGLATAGFTPSLQAKNSNEIHYKIDKHDISKLYRAIENAEVGKRRNKWIRTEYQPPKGSTAYGPVQITTSLIQTAKENHPSFYNKHKKYLDKFIKQGKLFSKYGGKDMVKGYERYDYGQHGDLDNPSDHVAYVKMAYDLMQVIMKEANNDLLTFIEKWRGKKAKDDKRYYQTVLKTFLNRR